MDKKSKSTVVYKFGDFTLYPSSERLFQGSQAIKLEPQLYALLWLFVQNPNVIVSRDTIERDVWMGRPVTDESIRAALKKLRDCLGDDARAPHFLKTIPRQGYKWLAPVTKSRDNGSVSGRIKKGYRKYGNHAFGTILLLVIIYGAFAVFSINDADDKAQHEVPVVTRMTALAGSEVNADYHEKTGKLAFLHRETKSSPQQLYIKTLGDNLVSRLSWDNANYSDSHWSSDGSRLAFTRLLNGQYGFHVAWFSDNGDVDRVETLSSSDFNGKFIIGWLHDDAGLLLAEKLAGSKVHGIYAYNIEQETMIKLTSPNVSGRGDYGAAISEDGEWLALLREEVAKEATLLVVGLKSGDVVGKSSLPFMPSRLVWHQNTHVAMTNFFGEHARYSVPSNTLTQAVSLPDNTLDVFATCGPQCYIMRQHNGNFLDLQEIPLASVIPHNDAKVSVPLLQSARLLKRAGAQDFPQYFTQSEGMFFVTLKGKHQLFQVMAPERTVKDVATLHAKHTISALALAPDNKQFIGISDGRIFQSDLTHHQVSTVKFITTSLTRYENPSWDTDSEHLFVTQITDNVPRIVRLSTTSLQSTPVIENMLAFKLNEDNASKAYGVMPNLNVVTLSLNNGQWQVERKIGQIPSASPNRWVVSNNRLYYTKHVMPEAFLCRTLLHHQEQENSDGCWSIGDNRFRLHFDLNTNKQTVLLVESLSAQSDIVKLAW